MTLDLRSNKQLYKYLTKKGPLARWELINQQVFLKEDTPAVDLEMVTTNPIKWAVRYAGMGIEIHERMGNLVFELPAIGVPSHIAAKIASIMQMDTKLTLGAVIPFGIPGPMPNTVVFLATGALPRAKLPRQTVDDFMSELTHTYAYIQTVTQALLSAGMSNPQDVSGPPMPADFQEWFTRAAQAEAKNRPSEFDLGPPNTPPDGSTT